MSYRRPLFLSQLSGDVGGALARFSGLDGFARAILASVIPLMALGGLFLIFSVLLFAAGQPALFALGIGLRSAGAWMFSLCMSLYIMAYIGKRELAQNKSRAVRRFWAQPRLRLAYLIALSRACFWSGLFVYGPFTLSRRICRSGWVAFCCRWPVVCSS